jgi:hypothetical protein
MTVPHCGRAIPDALGVTVAAMAHTPGSSPSGGDEAPVIAGGDARYACYKMLANTGDFDGVETGHRNSW